MNFWISFHDVPKPYSLEVIRGSHRGTLYDGTMFESDDPTQPFWGEAGSLPRLPDIEKERAADPSSWDVVSYDIEAGDVILFHPRCLHGGGSVDENFPERRSLGLRLCGEDAYWGELPVDTSQLTDFGKSVTPGEEKMEPGEPMRGAKLA